MRPLLLALLLFAGGCRFGRVTQGSVVEYRPEQGLLTIVDDSGQTVVVSTPRDPAEMGPAPTPGRLLRIDPAGLKLTYFDQSIRTIPIVMIDRKPALAPHGPFPRVDRAGQTITVYSPHDRQLIRFSVSAKDLELPLETWRFGDEVRYYYKEPGRALRLMNVTQTNLE